MLGRETVPFDPDSTGFPLVPEGIYPVTIEDVVRKEMSTKFGMAKTLDIRCRIIGSQHNGNNVFGKLFVYTTEDNPEPGFFDDKMWVNNGYFTFVKAVGAFGSDDLTKMIKSHSLPLLNDEDVVGRTVMITVTHRSYWKNDIPVDKRTEDNKTPVANVSDWMDEETGAAFLGIKLNELKKADEDDDNNMPF